MGGQEGYEEVGVDKAEVDTGSLDSLAAGSRTPEALAAVEMAEHMGDMEC